MNEVERVYDELKAVGAVVAGTQDVSVISSYGAHSAKILLLTSASYFERAIVSAIEEHLYAGKSSSVIKHFAFHQSISRKFFVLFDFSAETKNINAFLAKFGPDFAGWAKEDLAAQGITKEIQLTFLDLCRLRNSLVHNNYATYDINKTLDEIWSGFGNALRLVTWIQACFDGFEAKREV